MAATFNVQSNDILHTRLEDIEKAMKDLGKAIDQVILIRNQQIITNPVGPTYHADFADTSDSTADQKIAFLALLEDLATSVRGNDNAAIRVPFVKL